MQTPSYLAERPPAIPVQKYWMPGEWSRCDMCKAMRLISNLMSICYMPAQFENYERCLHVCADTDACKDRALERKRNAEA